MQDTSLRLSGKLAPDRTQFRQLDMVFVYDPYGIVVIGRSVTVFPVMLTLVFRESDLSSGLDPFTEIVKGIL